MWISRTYYVKPDVVVGIRQSLSFCDKKRGGNGRMPIWPQACQLGIPRDSLSKRKVRTNTQPLTSILEHTQKERGKKGGERENDHLDLLNTLNQKTDKQTKIYFTSYRSNQQAKNLLMNL